MTDYQFIHEDIFLKNILSNFKHQNNSLRETILSVNNTILLHPNFTLIRLFSLLLG